MQKRRLSIRDKQYAIKKMEELQSDIDLMGFEMALSRERVQKAALIRDGIYRLSAIQGADTSQGEKENKDDCNIFDR